jgi:hypothetical protein
MRRLLALSMSLGLLATMSGCWSEHCHCIMGVCDCAPDWSNCCRYGPPAQPPCGLHGAGPIAPAVAPIAPVAPGVTGPTQPEGEKLGPPKLEKKDKGPEPDKEKEKDSEKKFDKE